MIQIHAEKSQPSKSSPWNFPWGKTAMGGLMLGACFSGGFVANRLAQTPSLFADANTENALNRLGERFESVARRVSPSVVAVEASKPSAKSRRGSVDESGSGVIIRLSGQTGLFAVTNNHVVSDAAPEQITLNLSDGRIIRPSRVWTDPESDIALLKIEGDERMLTPATLGDSDAVRVGQWVLAFGSPFGLNQSVTHGIISAKERGQVSLGSTIRIKDFLQTDAAINPGSSGGPLLNMEGEVVGINTAIASTSGNNTGVSFSIPINLVRKVANELLTKGSVARGYLGFQVASSFEASDALKLGLDRVHGALVESVYPETPAAGAGLQSGDVLLRIDGSSIKNENHCINLIATLRPGQRVRLEVWRNRQAYAVEATVGDWAQASTKLKRSQG
jgi:S1-C subfamily serine protease